jgi:hypothetical protein
MKPPQASFPSEGLSVRRPFPRGAGAIKAILKSDRLYRLLVANLINNIVRYWRQAAVPGALPNVLFWG